MNSTLTPRPLMLAVALALSAWTSAHAQTAPAAPAQDGSVDAKAADKTQLETVTVTAQRRKENIKDVPTAVTTLGGDALDAISASGEDVRDLSGRLPSLNIESSFGRAFPRFYIRGYGNTDFHLNASQPVSLVYDDVVQENPILKGFPVFDVQQVEVIAGPQGTLFGRNTPAGVVKFDSVAPSHKDDGYVSLGLGNLGTINLEGAANVPMTGDWAVRISAQEQHRENWVHNAYVPTTPDPSYTPSTEGYSDGAVRVQALYQDGGDFSALFNIHHRDLDGSPRLFRAGIIQPGTNNLIAGFNPNQMSIDGDNQQHVTATGGSARLKWTLPEFDVYSISAIETVQPFSRGDVDGGSAYIFSYSPPAPAQALPVSQLLNQGGFPDETSDALHGHRQLTQEVRLESKNASPFNWQGGLFLFDERYTWEQGDYSGAPPYGTGNALYEETHQSNRAYALFGAVTYQVTSELKIGGGLRYTDDKKNLNSWVPATNGQTLNPYGNGPAGSPTNPTAASTKDSKWTWDTSAVYSLDRSTNVYAKIGTGFRASAILPIGEFSGLTTAGPETVTSYEVGIKSDFWQRRARLSADVYTYDVSHLQLTEVGGAGNSNTAKSANKVNAHGLELNLDVLPIDNLMLHLSGSINDTKINDSSLTVASCGGGCTVNNPFVGGIPTPGGEVYVNGNPLPNAPKYIGNFNLRYGFPQADGSEVYVYTDWTYRSSVNFFIYEATEFTGKPLTEGGLRAGYIWHNGKYEVAAYVRNIANKIEVTGAIDFDNLTGFINDPRTYGVQFKALF